VPGLDHVFLHVGSKSVLRPENRPEPRARMRRETIGDVPQLGVDRRGIAQEANAPAVEDGRIEQALGAKSHGHDYRVGPTTPDLLVLACARRR